MDKLGNKVVHTLPPEDPYGDIEYKWDLSDINRTKKIKVMTQMRWRICEESETGSGLYVLGVHDNGQLTGIEYSRLIKTYIHLMSCAGEMNMSTCLRLIEKVGENNWWAVVQVFKRNICDTEIPKVPVHPLPEYLKTVGV